MPFIGVHESGQTEPRDDQRWLVNRLGDAVQSITLDLDAFANSSDAVKLFSLYDDDTTNTTIVSGVPLVKEANGLYKPAADGGSDEIAGVLDEAIPVTFTRKGLISDRSTAPLRYAAVIDLDYLPVKPASGAKWDGLFINNNHVDVPKIISQVGSAAAASSSAAPASASSKSSK